ncbi:MAG: c-type cytochrome [Bacteroidales bacterium]|jgi:YVTN family beta-propeller protein|nr:c-type cytochrome [Bacteroidales bacterium]
MIMNHTYMKYPAGIAGILLLIVLSVTGVNGQQAYLSPTRMAVHPVTKEVYVLLSTARSLAKVDPVTEKVTGVYPLGFVPSDLCFSAVGNTLYLYVTEYEANGKVHILSPVNCKKGESIDVGYYPDAICVNRQGTRAWVANRFSNDVSVIDLSKRREVKRLPMVREPRSLTLSPDEKLLAVGNYLPLQSSLESPVTARVTLVDTERDAVVEHVPLSDGTQSIEDVRFSKNGDMIFATHVLSRYFFPTTQLERGWMNTNAVSLISVAARKYYATLLLDDIYLGAANPCGMTLSSDGDRLFVAASGTHELIAVSLPPVLEKIRQQANPADLANNLTFLSGHKVRIPMNGKGARYVVMQDNKLFVSNYFSGGLTVVDANAPAEKRFIKLGSEPEPDSVRKGELYFADASLCFQNWQSCVTCHPGGRADGLNWDLMNDGIGNPKNTKSMLYSHVTPPGMITGIRTSAEIAVRAGIHHIQFAERPEEDAVCIDAYLKSLRPVPSPYLVNGKLSRLAKQGETLFVQAGCNSCHNGEYLTDGKMYNAGTGVEEYTDAPFDTPALKEMWRTAPYLYNGSAVTIRDVITKFNKNDRHGETSKMSEKEIEALERYILSL